MRLLLATLFMVATLGLHAQQPCIEFNAKTITDWRSAHPAGYAAQEPLINVDNPFPSEVILHFYNPATQQLFESYKVPAGAQLRGLRYRAKPFLPASDWGVRLSKGGETSCTQFLGSLVQTDGGALLLRCDGFTKNGFLIGATAGVPRKKAAVAEAEPEPESEDSTEATPKTPPPARERAYTIYVQNRNAFPIEMAYAREGEAVHAWTVVPPGRRVLLFQSKNGSFCIRGEYTDANGARKGWGGDVEKVVNGEKKKFRCRVLGATEWTYTAVFG
ncbi:MAG: hypothetical protein EOO08_15480 [Chitinophagaceae bacterium]|nr:MAG: hypothetical protein EOO08_15480 [Chitinophagaceae bacterium]